ncbi:MAG TPA: hypothetical protein VGG35_22410 [Streptosporangiaceae bacterium]|jgi:hypothetical protein
MPFAKLPEAQPATRRDKRVLLVAGLLVLAIFAGVGIWAALRPGSYGASGHGCVTVNLPSSMGGSLVHGCGDRARQMCRDAYVGRGTAARLTAAQCQIAGISPPPSAPSAASSAAPPS